MIGIVRRVKINAFARAGIWIGSGGMREDDISPFGELKRMGPHFFQQDQWDSDKRESAQMKDDKEVIPRYNCSSRIRAVSLTTFVSMNNLHPQEDHFSRLRL